jgi:hypothetical protein
MLKFLFTFLNTYLTTFDIKNLHKGGNRGTLLRNVADITWQAEPLLRLVLREKSFAV